MKNQKGFVPIIIILVVLVGFVGVYYLGTFKTKTTTVNPTSTPVVSVEPSSVPTAKPVTIKSDESLTLTKYLVDKYYDQSKQYGKSKDEIVINISKLEGNYATGSGSFKSGGGDIWFASKVNNEWYLVEQTQEPPSCKLMMQFNFPKSIYGECIEK